MIVRNVKGILTRFYACEYHILNLKRERRDWKSKFRYNLQVEVLKIWKQKKKQEKTSNLWKFGAKQAKILYS